MKILSNEALELSYDATEEIEEISKEGDELEDELDVAGDIVIEAEEGEATASKLLANPIVEPGSAEEGNLIKITRLTNESLIRVTEKLNLPGYTYTASFEAFVDPYTSLEVSREGFKEIVTKMIEKVKEIWIKIKEVFKKLFRASMRKLQTSVTKLENLIKDLPQSEETYKLSEQADESSFNKALKIADNCPPRTDNASKVMGAKLAETIKALIPDLDGQTSATNKWASEITAYSTTVKNSAKTDANGQSTGPDASKLEAVIKTAIDFTKYEAKYWKNSDLAANGATHLVVGHPDAGVFINKDKPEFKKSKMEANDAEHTKYVNALKNASTTVNELKDLLSFLKEIPNKQEVLNKAIDQAIAKIDRELLTGLDSLKNVKSTPNTSTANTNSQANNGTANKENNADKSETKASNSNIGTYKGLMMLVPVVLNGSYKQLGDAVNGGIAIVTNIKAQISGGTKEEEKADEGGNNKETSQSNESLDYVPSREVLETAIITIGAIGISAHIGYQIGKWIKDHLSKSGDKGEAIKDITRLIDYPHVTGANKIDQSKVVDYYNKHSLSKLYDKMNNNEYSDDIGTGWYNPAYLIYGYNAPSKVSASRILDNLLSGIKVSLDNCKRISSASDIDTITLEPINKFFYDAENEFHLLTNCDSQTGSCISVKTIKGVNKKILIPYVNLIDPKNKYSEGDRIRTEYVYFYPDVTDKYENSTIVYEAVIKSKFNKLYEYINEYSKIKNKNMSVTEITPDIIKLEDIFPMTYTTVNKYRQALLGMALETTDTLIGLAHELGMAVK